MAQREEFEWKISSDTLQQMKDTTKKTKFKSPSFTRHSVKWHLNFYPMYKDQNCALFLYCESFPDSGKIEIDSDCKINKESKFTFSKIFGKDGDIMVSKIKEVEV